MLQIGLIKMLRIANKILLNIIIFGYLLFTLYENINWVQNIIFEWIV